MQKFIKLISDPDGWVNYQGDGFIVQILPTQKLDSSATFYNFDFFLIFNGVKYSATAFSLDSVAGLLARDGYFYGVSAIVIKECSIESLVAAITALMAENKHDLQVITAVLDEMFARVEE